MAETIKYGILLQLRDEVTGALGNVQKGLMKFKDNIDGASRTARRGLVALGAAVGAVAYKAMEQEKADRKLSDALRTAGDDSKETFDRMKDLAAAMQDATVYGDEEIEGLIALGKNLGISTDDMDKAVKGAVGLAEAFDIDLQSAMRYVALALGGQYDALQRQIPALRDVKDPAEKLAIVEEAMAAGFEQAKGRAEETEGALLRLKGVFGDLLEVVGKEIFGVDDWGESIERLKEKIKDAIDWVTNLTDKQREWILWGVKAVAVTLGIVAVLGPLAGALSKVVGLLALMTGVTAPAIGLFAVIAAALLVVADSLGILKTGAVEFIRSFAPIDEVMTSMAAGMLDFVDVFARAQSSVVSSVRDMWIELMELREKMTRWMPAVKGLEALTGMDPKQTIADLRAVNAEAKRMRAEGEATTSQAVNILWRDYAERHPAKVPGEREAPGEAGPSRQSVEARLRAVEADAAKWQKAPAPAMTGIEQLAREAGGTAEATAGFGDDLLPLLVQIVNDQNLTKEQMERFSKQLKRISTARR